MTHSLAHSKLSAMAVHTSDFVSLSKVMYECTTQKHTLTYTHAHALTNLKDRKTHHQNFSISLQLGAKDRKLAISLQSTILSSPPGLILYSNDTNSKQIHPSSKPKLWLGRSKEIISQGRPI